MYGTFKRGQLRLSSLSLRLVPGTLSVLEYLLSPVQKIAHEAGRER
jgi:hypothetical protein